MDGTPRATPPDAPPARGGTARDARRADRRRTLALVLAAVAGATAVVAARAAPEAPETGLRRHLRHLQASLLLARTAGEEAGLLRDLAALADPEAPRWRIVVQARARDLTLDRPVPAAAVDPSAPPFTWGADVDVGRTDRDSGAGRRLLVFRVRLRDARNLSLLGIDVPGVPGAAPSPAPEAGDGR